MTDQDIVKGAIIALGVAFDNADDQLKVAAATVRSTVFEEQKGMRSPLDTDVALTKMREAKAKVDRLRLAIQALEDALPDALEYQSVAVEEHMRSLPTTEGDDLTQKVPAVW